MSNERLCVVMPVFNEQEIIQFVLKKWSDVLTAMGIDYQIRAYNDGSTDGTLLEMRKASENLPSVDVRDKTNGGHGNTILTGYQEAVADGFDWILQVDSDDEMPAEEFKELWSHRHDHDFLVGRRVQRKQPLSRKIVSCVSRWCSRIFYGKSVTDVNSPYRLMRVLVFGPFFSSLPKSTFAPNVILSGLAACHSLRCFEIDVRHQERKTGEVSIRKWKLLKVAAMSFGQTVCHAVRNRTGNSLVLVGFLFGALLAGYTAFKLNFNSFGWVDEVGTADTAVNMALHGKWFSHNWPYSYHPLHMWILVPWLKIFGVSHVSVCSLNVLWAMLSCWLLTHITVRRKIFTAFSQVLFFVLLFWGSMNLAWTAMSGRIDCMVMFFTVCVFGLFMRENAADGKPYLVGLAFASFLLAMTGIYTIPLFVFYWILCIVCPFGAVSRAKIFRRGVAVCVGSFLAFAVVAISYLYHQAFFRYLYMTFSHCTTVSGVSIGSTVGYSGCYLTEWHVFVALIVTAILSVANRVLRRRTNWIQLCFVFLIPPLMVLAGRYAWYYHWIFSIPVGIFVCWSLGVAKRTGIWLVMGCVALATIYTQINWFSARVTAKKSVPLQGYTELLSRNGNVFTDCKDIVITRYWGYYPSIEAGLLPWVREPEQADTFLMTTVNRADSAIDKMFKDEKWREIAKKILFKVEKISSARFPENGFLFAHDSRSEVVMRDVFRRLNYIVEAVDAHGDLRLLRFSRAGSVGDKR